MLTILLSLLGACSGDEPSDLLSSTGGTSSDTADASAGDASTGDTSGGAKDLSINLLADTNKQLANGIDKIALTALVRDSNKTPVQDVEVSISASSDTVLFDQGKGNTDASGTAVFNITNTEVENVIITATALGKTATQTVNFVNKNVTLTFSVSNDKQFANGESAIKIEIFAKDDSGNSVEGLPISVQLPTDKAVKSNPSQGSTLADGSFTTEITSTQVGEILVKFATTDEAIAIKGKSEVTITFVKYETVANISLSASSTLALPNGTDKITLTATVYDSANQKVPNIDVSISANSGTAVFDKNTNKTDADGVVIFNLTNTTAEDVKITVTAQDKTATLDVKFINVNLTTNVINNNQLANGTDAITVEIIARNDQGNPIPDLLMQVQLPTDSVAKSDPSEGSTQANGSFSTNITSTKPGDVKVTLLVKNTSLSQSKTVTFVQSEEVKDVVIDLITSNPQLGSEGNSEGVTITAFVINKDNNNPVEDIVLSFSSCLKQTTADKCDTSAENRAGGEIIPIQVDNGTKPAGITDQSGRAQARLTTKRDHDNRTILVKSRKLLATDESTIPIDVIGTAITVTTDTQNMIRNESTELSISLKDSAGVGINQQMMKVKSSSGNSLCWLDKYNCSNPQTDQNSVFGSTIEVESSSNGQATVRFFADQSFGEDTVTVTKASSASNSLKINISQDKFTLTSDKTEINLNTWQKFQVHWEFEQEPQQNEQIFIFSTRGELNPTDGFPEVTDAFGNTTFEIKANNVGPAVITAVVCPNGRNEVCNGPSTQAKVEFVATEVNSITLQATPITIGINESNSDLEQSDILAVVRDPNNNLVKNKRINFTLDDVTGGRLSLGSDVTDSFGRASTVYIAGTTSSAANGVIVTATVVEDPKKKDQVKLTVAEKSLFITLGTGNVIDEDGNTRYKYPYTVLVTDASGVGKAGVKVVLNLLPLFYRKGCYDWNSVIEKWVDSAGDIESFENEDRNFNGILDANEDENGNGVLEPGNVATLDIVGGGNIIETDSRGFADFFVAYPRDYGNWVIVKLIATVAVEGTEGQEQRSFLLQVSSADLTNEDIQPPGFVSPFGVKSEHTCGRVVTD